jgi:nucleoside-diphosphate-sugar epimerase
MLAGQRTGDFRRRQHSRDFTYVENVVHANLLAQRRKPRGASIMRRPGGAVRCSIW